MSAHIVRSAQTLRRIARLARTLGAAAVVLGSAPDPGIAQGAGRIEAGESLYSVRMSDGSTVIARVSEVQGDSVVLLTSGGARIQLQRAAIVAMRPATERGPLDPNRSRLLFGPTGRTLEAGTGYLGLFEAFFPFLSYGATDYLTLSGGTPIIPGAMGQVFYLAPKARVLAQPNLNVSAGVLAFFATEALDEGSVGILYGAGTWGSLDDAVTAGAGWPFMSDGGDSELADPIFLVGGETRTGTNMKLITENYVFTGSDGGMIASVGVRRFGEHISGDIGFAAFIGEGGSCCMPLLNVVYTF